MPHVFTISYKIAIDSFKIRHKSFILNNDLVLEFTHFCKSILTGLDHGRYLFLAAFKLIRVIFELLQNPLMIVFNPGFNHFSFAFNGCDFVINLLKYGQFLV